MTGHMWNRPSSGTKSWLMKGWMAATSIALMQVAAVAASAQSEPTITLVDSSVSVRLEAQGRPTLSQSDRNSVSATLQGTERSDCDANYGRKSFARGASSIRFEDKEGLTKHISLKSQLLANGGHFRNCSFCSGNQCVIVHGNDTKAKASTNAISSVRIKLPDALHPGTWYLELQRGSLDPDLNIQVLAPSGTSLDPISGSPTRFLLQGSANDEYFVNSTWPKAVINDGGCCEDAIDATTSLTIRLERGPLLYSLDSEPFIRGGSITSGFTPVGVMRIDGLPHCSGTVVGKRTVLTAAHCISGYHRQIESGRVSFAIGESAFQPKSSYVVKAGTFPTDASQGFNYNFSTLEDDVGLLFVEGEFADVTPVRLHQGSPAWSVIEPLPLVFVGFGYNVFAGEQVGVGIKREAAWKVDQVLNRTVRWAFSKQSTCKADSGGPALFTSGSELILVAVTSSGNANCTSGTNMRVDAYASWIVPRIDP